LTIAERFEWSPEKRCPYGTIRDVLGQSTISRLLDHVTERESAFKAGVVRSRMTGDRRVDRSVRDSYFLTDMGPFRQPIEIVVREIASLALARLGLAEPAVEPGEFEFACYADGSHFATHVDTNERLQRVRVLSCVYYFSETPRRFSGGELRLYGFPDPFHESAGPIAEIIPEADSLVIFPSWLEHAVLPVSVPSKSWRDCRFSINCWIHRAAARADTPEAEVGCASAIT
jgi:SM-20-related protein